MGYLPYIQVILAVLLVAGVLIQRSDGNLGAGFGGDGSFGTRFSRRGLEKMTFNATLVVAVLFVISVLIPLVLL